MAGSRCAPTASSLPRAAAISRQAMSAASSLATAGVQTLFWPPWVVRRPAKSLVRSRRAWRAAQWSFAGQVVCRSRAPIQLTARGARSVQRPVLILHREARQNTIARKYPELDSWRLWGFKGLVERPPPFREKAVALEVKISHKV